jgi:hypothetical protein
MPGKSRLTTPKVSVLLTAYNHERYIAQAIESVLLQETQFPIEIVLSDDFSTDATRDLVVEYAQRHPEIIRPVLPERNLGANEIFQRQIAAARGQYIALLDGDDYWTSRHKLQRQVEMLDSRPEWIGCFHDVSLISEITPIGVVLPKRAESAFGLEDLLRACFIAALSVVYRREALTNLPKWVFDFDWSDWPIHMCASRLGAIGYLPETMGAYRLHSGGMFSARDRSTQIEEEIRLYERLSDALPDEHRELISRCIVDRRMQLAVEEARLAFAAPLVVIDAFGDIPPYFNGRHARYVNPSEVTDVTMAELRSTLHELSKGSPASPHYEPRSAPHEGGEGKGFVLVPRTAFGWLEAHPDVKGSLESCGARVRSDDWCLIYELPVDREPGPEDGMSLIENASPLIEVWRSSLAKPHEELRGWHLDLPRPGDLAPVDAIFVAGWSLGEAQRAVAVEFETNGELIWRAPLGHDRPDLAEAFPDQPDAARAGFSTTVNATGTPTEFELAVFALLEDDRPPQPQGGDPR